MFPTWPTNSYRRRKLGGGHKQKIEECGEPIYYLKVTQPLYKKSWI